MVMKMKVIVALDVPTPDEAIRLVGVIGSDWYKIGLELIYHPERKRILRISHQKRALHISGCQAG